MKRRHARISSGRGVAAGIALAAAAVACRRAEPPPPMEAPRIEASAESPWRVTRSGLSPVLAALEGRATVALEPAYDPEIRRLPGVTMGSDEGTRPAVIAGLLAPTLAPIASDRAYRVSAWARPEALEVVFAGRDAGIEGFRVAVGTGTAGRARLEATGAFVLLLPADRTEVRTTLRGAPSQAFRVDAEAAPGVRAVIGDRLEIRAPRAGVVTIETSCARPRLVTPIRRGSTSVFLLALGPLPPADDPFFSPGPAGDALTSDAAQKTCSSTTTATITVPWSPRAPA